MNMTIELSERGVRDGVILIGAYHFLLAVVMLLGSMAVFVYTIMPVLTGSASGAAQSLFLPILGVIIGLILMVSYALTGLGLVQIRNSARMMAIFLSLFGIVGGLFGAMGGIVGSFTSMQPDYASIALISTMLVCSYSVLTFLDIITLVFLLNWRVRAVFYGEEWLAQASEAIPELGHRVSSPIKEIEGSGEY